MSNKSISIYTEGMKRQGEEKKREKNLTQETTRTIARKSTQSSDNIRGSSRDTSRGKSRDNSGKLPTRDEIQGFSFDLRDELKVKVQAEVPHQWQAELENVARDLNVKKLELYRFIFGEFLGKTRRKKTS